MPEPVPVPLELPPGAGLVAPGVPVVPPPPTVPLELPPMPVLPEPMPLVLPEVCATDTVAAPTSAAATAAHSIFIIILGLLKVRGRKVLQVEGQQMLCRTAGPRK